MDIPQDIIDNVIEAVGDDRHMLKQCALISSSFLLPCRKQLFSKISIGSNQSCQRIHQILVQNPAIQSFVRTITLNGSGTIYTRDLYPFKWMNSTELLSILRLPFCCLECFSIIGCRDDCQWDWDSFSSEMKDALSNTIMHPSLKTLSLTDITKVPISFFFHDVHLTTLELFSIAPDDFDGESSSPLMRTALKGLAPHCQAMSIDRCVWSFRVSYWSDGWYEIPFVCLFSLIQDQRRFPSATYSTFLPFISHLRFLEIYIDLGRAFRNDFNNLSFLMCSLEVSLTSPATLEHLKFNIRFRSDTDNFNFNTFYENLRHVGGSDAWSHLDSIATHPAGSRLQRVDININYAFRCNLDGAEPDKDKVLKAVLHGLPLLRTKGILFVEAVWERMARVWYGRLTTSRFSFELR